MRLFNSRPASNLNVGRSFSEPSCSAVSKNKKTFSRCRTPAALSAISKVDRGKRSQKTLLTEDAPPAETQCYILQAMLGGSPCALWIKGAQNPTLSGQTKLEGNSITQETFFEAMRKSIGKTVLPRSHSRKGRR